MTSITSYYSSQFSLLLKNKYIATVYQSSWIGAKKQTLFCIKGNCFNNHQDMKHQTIILLVLILLGTNNTSFGWNQPITNNLAIVTPPISTFSKDEYNAERQNWDISSAKSGYVYFANNLGLLRYDGENWSLYKTPNPLRAVFCSNDTIYVGGNGLMGYFVEKNLQLGFQSLSNIPNDIWKIYRINDHLIFQAFDKLYHINKNGIIGSERFKTGNTTFTYPEGKDILYQINYGDLIALTPDGDERILSNSPGINKLMITYLNKLNTNTILIGTLEEGLFLLINNKLTPIDNALNDFIKTYKLNRAIRLDKDYYAFATMNGGVVIANLKGHIAYVLNRSNGLSNNRVHAIHLHKNRFLWVATDNGISLVDLKNPIHYFNNQFVELGSFYDIAMYKEAYYVGTNHGLYKITPLKDQVSIFDIELVNGSEGQIWNVEVIDGELWIGHNNGTYLLEKGKLKPLSKIAGGYTMLQSKHDNSIVYQTSYFSVAVYKKTNNQWQLQYTIPDIKELTRDLIELPDGSLIVSGGAKTLFQIWPDNYQKMAEVKNLSNIPELNKASWIRAFDVQGQVLVTSNDTSFFYSPKEGINACPPEFNQVSYVSEVINNHVFLRHTKLLSLYNLTSQKIEQLPYDLNKIENELIFKFEKIAQPVEGQIMFCLSDRIASTSLTDLKRTRSGNDSPSITSIECSNDRSGEEGAFEEGGAIPYKFNTIRFTYTAFSYGTETSYEYLLEGYNNQWQNRDENVAVFQNLHEGTYTFKVREKGGTNIDSVTFTISPPLLRSKLAYFAYLVAFIILLIASRNIYLLLQKKRAYLKLQKERKRLNDLRLLSTRQQLGMEVKQLQEEVTNKSDKLTNLLLQNNKKKEVIDKINEELKHIRENLRFSNGRQIDRLSKMIKSSSDEKKDWLLFEAAFSEAHANFFKKLRTRHNNLTEEDLKLCAYIKANLSSKELAPILKITPRSVDLKKYRLKKKMDLTPEENLKQYIMDFDY